MKLTETIKISLNEIRHHKIRSFLSFFSIMIGVISIIYTLTVVYAINSRFEEAIKIGGPGRIEIRDKERRWGNYSNSGQFLTLEDAYLIKKHFPELYMVSPYSYTYNSIYIPQANYRRYYASIQGITPQWRKRDWIYKLKGRFLNDYDIENRLKVCIIKKEGEWIKKPGWLKFYDDYSNNLNSFQSYIKHNDILGKEIIIENQTFKVVGIIEEPVKEKDFSLFATSWGEIYIPITLIKSVNPYKTKEENEDIVSAISIDTGDKRTVRKYKRIIKEFIKSRKGDDDFLDIKDFTEIFEGEIIERKRTIFTVMIIGAIAIISGGIGIMNVLLASIYSRVKEIGIRRAIGASKADIIKQFVIESITLGFMGGVAGSFIGIILIIYLKSKGDMNMIFFRWWMIIAAIFVAILASFLSSIYPAKTAANLNIVESLKYE